MIRGSILDYVNIVTFMGKGYNTLLPKGLISWLLTVEYLALKKWSLKSRPKVPFFRQRDIL